MYMESLAEFTHASRAHYKYVLVGSRVAVRSVNWVFGVLISWVAGHLG